MYNINCSKCRKMQNPYLDLYSDKVCCELCDAELNVTNIIKQQLKAAKRTKSDKPKQSFSFTCPVCKFQDRPLVKDKNLFCKKCKSDLKISEPFKNLFFNSIGKADSDVD